MPAPLVGLHLCVGAPLVLAPGTLLDHMPHQRADRTARAFARLLGARHIAEAAVLARRHTSAWILAGATVDATHTLTMVLLAWLRPTRRELALTSAAGETLLAAYSVRYSRRAHPSKRGYAEPAAGRDAHG